MRILQIIQRRQLRGAEIFCSQLSEHLRREGHEVVIVALQRGDAPLPFGGHIESLDRPAQLRLFDLVGYGKLASLINKFKPDIVQANAGDTLKFAVSSKLLSGWKQPLVFRNANKVSDFLKGKRLTYALNRFFVRHVNHVISVSSICRNDFVDTYKVSPTKVSMIPIGVDPVQEQLVPVSLPGQTGKTIVSIGSLVPEKNHLGLLRIMSRVIKDVPDARLYVIGDGKLRDLIEVRISELGLAEHVTLLGYRRDVLSIMGGANVMVMPSLIEGLPGVILEAFQMRLPVVAYNAGGIGEVVRHNETGALVPIGDESAFVAELTSILLDSAKVDKLVRNASSLVETEFRNEVIAARFLDCYEMILTSRHGH